MKAVLRICCGSIILASLVADARAAEAQATYWYAFGVPHCSVQNEDMICTCNAHNFPTVKCYCFNQDGVDYCANSLQGGPN